MTDRLKKLQEFLEKDPNDPFLLFAIAKEYENSNQLETALSKYQELIQIDPDYVGTYYHLAKLQEELELSEEAIKIYQKGIEVAKKQKDMHSMAELTTALANLQMEL